MAVIRRFVEVARDHEIVRNLVIKELKVRYRGSYLGFLWALLNPLLTMLVFWLVATVVVRIEQELYPLFWLCGYLPWVFFQHSLSQSSTSIIFNANLIKKVLFPREIFPIANILACLVNFGLGLCVLAPFLIAYGRCSARWLLLPVVLIIHLTFTLGLGFFLSSTNVFFRDIGNLIEIVLFAWFYVTPIFYPLRMVTERLKDLYFLYLLNPLASIIVLYRHALFEPKPPQVVQTALIVSVTAAVVALVVGHLVFSRLQHLFPKEL